MSFRIRDTISADTKEAKRVGLLSIAVISATLLVLSAVLFGSLCATAARAAGTLSWSQPQLVDHHAPYGSSAEPTGIDCPSSGLCVAVDSEGSILTSTSPTTSAQTWTTTEVPGLGRSFATSGVSCPSVDMCIAVHKGNVLASSDPTDGGNAWHIVKAYGYGELKSVSCPTENLCVAVGSEGTVLSSAEPTNSASWKETFASGDLLSVSCPTDSLCAAVNDSGDVITSTDPTGGAAAWTTTHVDSSEYLDDVSCASEALCVATDFNGDVVTSTDPTDGAAAWTITHLSTEAMASISCVTTSFCVAINFPGNVFTATNPAGGAGAWEESARITDGEAVSLHCLPSGECFGVNENDLVYSVEPSGGASKWHNLEGIDSGGANPIKSVSCPAANMCAAVDEPGNVLSSTDPTLTATWFLSPIAGALPGFTDIDCVSDELCVADAAPTGNLWASTEPAAGPAAWAETQLFKPSTHAVSCASAKLCVSVGYLNNSGGAIITSTEPTGGVSAWHETGYDPGNNKFIEGVSCPTEDLCVAVENEGGIITSTEPLAGAGAWHMTKLNGEPYLKDISCPSSHLCVAVGESGQVFTTTEPTAGASAWKSTSLPAAFGTLPVVSCPSASFCAAVDEAGQVLTSTNPTGGESSWEVSTIDTAYALTSISCASSELCVAGDKGGDIVVGSTGASGTFPYATGTPSISGTAEVGQTLTESHASWANNPTSYAYQWEDCDSAGNNCTAIPDATGQSYTLAAADMGHTIRVQETASNAGGESSPAVSAATAVVQASSSGGAGTEGGGGGGGSGGGAGSGGGVAMTATTSQLAPSISAPAPAPVLGQSQTVSVISGTVTVRVKGTNKFVPFSGASTILNGSEVEATNGRVLITVATPNGHTQTAEVWGGRFVVDQERTGSGETRFILSLPLTGCPRVSLPRGASAATAAATASTSVAKHNSDNHGSGGSGGAKSRHLWVSEGGGSWGTNGRYVSTTVEGTRWLTLDECDRSQVTVAAGKVKVHDLVNGKTKVLTAGKSYTATAKRHR